MTGRRELAIRRLAALRGITSDEELAERAGLPLEAVLGTLRGDPRLSELRAVARALGVPVAAVVCE